MERQISGRDWAIPFTIAVLCGLFFWRLGEPVSTGGLILLGFTVGFGCWALVNLGYLSAMVISDIKAEAKNLDFQLSHNFLAQQVAKMNDTQIRALKSGRQLLDIIPSPSGPVDKLYGEEVYLFTAWHILRNSTKTHVYAINNFSANTYRFDMLGDHAIDDNQQARNFHWWLVRYGWAKWSRDEGSPRNESARWDNGADPDMVMKWLGLNRDTYNDKDDKDDE